MSSQSADSPALTTTVPATGSETRRSSTSRELSRTIASPALVRVESNLLRFPFFALHTKRLRQIDFKEVTGTRDEDGQTFEFVFRVSRNTDYTYPGPLSRQAHYALLRLDAEKYGFPLRNPVDFTWRELARTMGRSWAGEKTTEPLKAAIRSTFGAIITSCYALKSGATRKSLPARERGYRLYADYVFLNEPMPDGTIADGNYVWFDDWYLANLNNFYTAQLDYDLWQRLNNQSPVASRLYEYLSFVFSSRTSRFVVNYPKLARFLPVKVWRYPVDAKNQLDPPLSLLCREAVINSWEWATSKTGLIQVCISPNDGLRPRLDKSPTLTASPEINFFEDAQIREGRADHSPAWMLVQNFHKQWSGQSHRRPGPAELTLARKLLEKYGRKTVDTLLPRVVKTMKKQYPQAKTFGATRDYFAAIHGQWEAHQRAAAREQEERTQQQAEFEQQRSWHREKQELRTVWQALPNDERENIRRSVLRDQPRSLQKHPAIVESFCLREIARHRPDPTIST